MTTQDQGWKGPGLSVTTFLHVPINLPGLMVVPVTQGRGDDSQAEASLISIGTKSVPQPHARQGGAAEPSFAGTQSDMPLEGL